MYSIISFGYYLTKGEFTLLSYEWATIAFIATLVMVQLCGLSCQMIAMQNDKPVVITLINYLGLVWAFLADRFIFEETSTLLERIAISMIFTFNVTLVI